MSVTVRRRERWLSYGLWSLLVLGGFAWQSYQEWQQVRHSAVNAAEANFNKDLALRQWATRHGGVYVPPDARTPPNPYLAHLPERDVVRQLLLFSRKGTQEDRPVWVQPLFKEVMRFVRATVPATIEVRPAMPLEPLYVRCEPTQLHQIIVNLCVNAAQAIDAGPGRIDVGLERIRLDAAEAKASGLAAGVYACLRVRDDGPGIPPEVRDRIFEPFFTTKELGRGTGLGLAVVHGIVQAHGGSISVETDAGQGTEFVVCLPLAPAPAADSGPTPGVSAVTPFDGLHVLLVDDEPGLLESTAEQLRLLGCRVTACGTPQAALDALQRHPVEYDVLLTDYTMPVMDGIALAHAARAIHPQMRLVLVTGYSEAVDELQARAAGIAALRAKPLLRNELEGLLAGLLRG